MPFCPYCNAELDIDPGVSPTVCPGCGREIDLVEEDASSLDLDLAGGETTDWTAASADIDLVSEELPMPTHQDSGGDGEGGGEATIRGSEVAGIDSEDDSSGGLILEGEDGGIDLDDSGDADAEAATYALDAGPEPPSPEPADSESDAESSPSPSASDDSEEGIVLEIDSEDMQSSSGASDRDAETIVSNTFPVDSGPSVPDQGRRPSVRQVAGIDSEDTAPLDLMGDMGSSDSIKPGDSVTIGSEQVRLKSHLLGASESTGAGPDLTGLDYKFVDGPFDGGMGRVWKSKQATLDRHVAIKQIKTDNVSQRDRDRFVSEAVITGTLEHPNIIPVHDLGLDPTGLPFYSMKFVEGVDWEDKVRDLSEAENLSILLQVAQAIAFAHSKDVIHMDLKPSNVRLGSFGEVLVMDWGLAARMAPGKEIQPGGTPMYMPPELALPLYRRYTQRTGAKPEDGQDPNDPLSQPAAPPGKYSDIYLLGALLFKIVTGRAPHRAKRSFDVLRKAARNEITRTSRRSELLDIAYKAMATDPANRYGSAVEFIDAIKEYQDHAQSIEIARIASSEVRAAEKLRESAEAEPKQLYESYARARHGYENALALWPENRKAERRLEKTKRVYAETAFENRDYDLALSLLDPEAEKDRELHVQVVASQRRRDMRERWFKRLQYATAMSLAAALVFIAVSIVLGFDAASKAKEIAQFEKSVEKLEVSAADAQAKAVDAEKRFDEAETKAAEADQKAESALAEAAKQERLAEDAKADLLTARTDLDSAKTELRKASEQAAIANANAEEALREALTEKANADYQRVRSSFLESGAYAASKVFATVPEETRNTDSQEWNYLRRRIDWRREAQELAAPVDGEKPRPALVATSADGEWVAALTVQEGVSRVVVSSTSDPTNPAAQISGVGDARAIAISDGGEYAVVLGEDASVWDSATGKRLTFRALESAPGLPGATAVAFHPTEQRLLVGMTDTAVSEWDINADTGELIKRESSNLWHEVAVSNVGYSDDGRLRYSADGDGVIRVWSGSLDQRPWSYLHSKASSGSSQITALTTAVRDGQRRLAYGCFDGAVYEIALGEDVLSSPEDPLVVWAETRPEKLGVAHPGSVTAIDYAQGGELILSTGGDLAMVRPAPGVHESQLKRVRRYHDQPLMACASDNLGYGYTSDSVGRVVRWRIDVRGEDLTFAPLKASASVVDAAIGKDDNSLIVADAAGFVRRWSTENNEATAEALFVGHADHRGFRAWSIASQQPRIVTVAADGRACVWDGSTGDLRLSIDLGGREVVACTHAGVLIAASARRDLDARAFSTLDGSSRQLWAAGPRVSCIEPLSDEGDSLAVALRDGQVYGWRAGRGREVWKPSSFRPHWRAVGAMHYDPRSGTLFSGDTGGGLGIWRIEQDNGELVNQQLLERRAPIVRLDSSSDGAALVLQRWAGVSHLSVSEDGSFNPTPCPSLNDACFFGDTIYALTDSGIVRRGVDDRGWSPIRNSPRQERILGDALRASGDGLLVYGPGFAEQLDARGDQLESKVRVDSRRRLVALGWSRDGQGINTIDSSGNLAGWSTEGTLRLSNLNLHAADTTVVASRPTGVAQQAVLALRDAKGVVGLELWDVSEGRRLRELAEGLAGEVEAITATPEKAAVVLSSNGNRNVLFVPLAGDEPIPSFELPARSSVVDLTLSPDGRRCVVVTKEQGTIVAQASKGDWSLSSIDRPGVSAATFSPDGDRLLLGLKSGQVLVLELLEVTEDDDSLETRRLLTLAGHGGPVTMLRFAADGERLVSGDGTGSVIVRTF